jgi:hypothetical protein
VAAHDADDARADEEFVEGVGHGVVVDAAEHRGEDVAPVAGAQEPVVRAGVGRRRVTGGEALVERVGAVERAAVRIEGQIRNGRKDERAGGAYAGGGLRLHQAAEEDRFGGVRRQEDRGTGRQVDGLDAVSAQGAGRDRAVELLQRLDLPLVR